MMNSRPLAHQYSNGASATVAQPYDLFQLPEIDLANEALDTVIVTNNKRSALFLNKYDRPQPGQTVWAARSVTTLSAWLSQLWQQMAGNTQQHKVLTSQQTLLLWRQIIKNDSQRRVITPDNCARLAAKSWKNLCEYNCLGFNGSSPTALEVYKNIPLHLLDHSNSLGGKYFIECLNNTAEPLHTSLLNCDQRSFINWSRQFQTITRENAWIDKSRLPLAIIDALNQYPQARLSLPKKVIFANFAILQPLYRTLCQTLREYGCEVSVVRLKRPRSHFTVYGTKEKHTIVSPFHTFEDELKQAVQYCAAKLKADSQARVAIVIPTLSDCSSQVKTLLDKMLCPHTLLAKHSLAQRPYNISAGQKLIDFPLFQDTLRLFNLVFSTLPYQEACALCNSQFLACGPLPACDEAQLRKSKMATFNLAQFLQVLAPNVASTTALAANEGPKHSKKVHGRRGQFFVKLRQLSQEFAHPEQKRSLLEWSQCFARCLKLIRHNYGESADTKTLSGKFAKVLNSFRRLSFVSSAGHLQASAMAYSEALAIFTSILQSLRHSAISQSARLQVLGLMEACDQQFSAMWITGLDYNNWPQPASLDSFVPNSLQIDHHWHNATPELSVRYAHTINKVLLCSAQEGVMSFSDRLVSSKGSQVIKICPLYSDYNENLSSFTPLPIAADWAEQELCAANQPGQPSVMEKLSFENPPPPQPTEKGPNLIYSGGTTLLKLQAQCPFRAFVENRLKCSAMDKIFNAVDSLEHGSLIHRVFEVCWETINATKGSQNSLQALQALDETALHSLVKSAVEQVLAEAQDKDLSLINKLTAPEVREREGSLLEKRVYEWFSKVEKQRQAPFNVEKCEEAALITLGDQQQLVISARIDRLDTYPEQGQALGIIDYKTGKTNTRNWACYDGQRIKEPQLPAYTVHLQKQAEQFGKAQPRALAFAQLLKNKLTLSGLAADSKEPVNKDDEQATIDMANFNYLKGNLCKSLQQTVKEYLSQNPSEAQAPPSNWELLIKAWEAHLNMLANEYTSGEAGIAPATGACLYCHLPLVCRKKQSLTDSDSPSETELT